MTGHLDQSPQSDPPTPKEAWGKRVAARLAFEWNDFWEAVFEAWWRVALGVSFGLGCFAVSFVWESSHPHGAKILEHTGMAFLVAAIAVFGYEWKSHRKAFVEVTRSMADALHAQNLTGAIRCVDETFVGSDPLNSDVRASITELLKALDHLVSQKLWHREIGLGLVIALIKSATENAHKFAENVEGGFPIELPKPAKLVAAMLETQMASMQKGDAYQVISDFSSFQKQQLADFMRKTQDQIKKGVSVNRIFVCFDHDFDLPVDEVERIIDEHWSAVADCEGNYIVGFIEPKRGSIEPQHEGVFTQGNVSIRFRPRAPDLSKMEFFPDTARSDVTGAYEKLAKLAVFAKAGADADRQRYKTAVRKAWSKGKKKKTSG